MSWQSEWKKCKKILCVRPDNLGDVILMTPIFRALKESLPHTMITLLTSTTGSRVTPYIPEIDETIIYNAPWIEREFSNDILQTNHHLENMDTVVKKIKKEKFDGAILLTNFSQSPFPLALITYLAEIQLVLGYARELPYPFLTHWVPDYEPFSFPIHGVNRQLKLLATIGIKTTNKKLSLSITQETETKIKRILKENDIYGSYILLHPGVSLTRRQYPINLLIETARKLIQELDYQIVITGIEQEKAMVTKMKEKIGNGSYSLAGQTTLGELLALSKNAALVISNNTSLVHIAAAMQTPVVDLYARSNPEHTPWNVRHRILYFDISPQLRSPNTLLSVVTPKHKTSMPQPHHIVQAAKELLLDIIHTTLPSEMTNWSKT